MVSRILLSLILSAPVSVMAQYVTTAPNGQLAPAGSAVVVVGNGGGPVLSTPSVTFGTPPATAGISLADRAGISNTTPTSQNIPSASESFPIYNNTNQPNSGIPNPATGESTAFAAANAANSGRLINDMGPSTFVGTGGVGGSASASGRSTAMSAVSGASLGEIAAKYKSARPQNIRTYTNADAQKLSDSINVHGANITPVNARNAAPAGTQGPSLGAVAQSASPAAPTQPQLVAGMRPSPSIRAAVTQSTATPQSGSASQGATAPSGNGTEAGQPGATTPQVSQPSRRAEDNDQGTADRLPASSTALPLLGLFGLVSGGIGMWLRKYRR